MQKLTPLTHDKPTAQIPDTESLLPTKQEHTSNTYEAIPPPSRTYSKKSFPIKTTICGVVVTLGLLAFALIPTTYFFYNYHVSASIAPTIARVPDLVRVQNLHPHHHPKHGKRLVIVGDVHGRLDALQHLLKKIDFKKRKDHLVFLGDMITKGHDSVGVIEYAMSINASCVRGNHEDAVLKAYAKHHRLPAPKVEPIEENFAEPETENMFEFSDPDGAAAPLKKKKKPVKDADVARVLKPEHIEYIGSCPAILSLGPGIGFHSTSAVAVHAGLQWHIPKLMHQHPETVFTMRTLLPTEFKKASEDRSGVPWSKIWTEKQNEKPRLQDRITVYYGHDAGEGLTIRKYSGGLDSGCVSGGRLTAMVVSHENGQVKHKVESVSCA